jgi:hypothetical protein
MLSTFVVACNSKDSQSGDYDYGYGSIDEDDWEQGYWDDDDWEEVRSEDELRAEVYTISCRVFA